MNERKTENYVRQKLAELGYYQNPNIIVEEQQSENPRIKKLLKNASKKGHGVGYPDFIISYQLDPNFLIIIECKADSNKHESVSKDKYSEYAVDGVLLYASYLSLEFDILAIAVSGENERNMCISHFLYLKNSNRYKSVYGDKILRLEDYYEGYKTDEEKFKQDYDSLLGYTKELNDTLHTNKIKEAQRSLLISGILIALQNPAFKSSYKQHPEAKSLINSLVATITTELSKANLKENTREILENAFKFMQTHIILSTKKQFLEKLISDIDEKVNSFIKTYKYLDTIGQFYIEFLRYANNDKGLGIVLTPPHITELFVELAEVNKDSVVLDNCCGTGGFLLSAMKKMIADAKGDKNKEKSIKEKQLIGIELQDDIFTLAVSNMIIHGDGKTNIFHGNCFDPEIISEVKQYKPTVGFLNPPYKVHKNDIEELSFVLNNLEMLEKNGKCVAIIPMSCVLATSGQAAELKKKLMEKHTLEAVMSMPDDLFYNSKVKVSTAIIVVTAHTPHPPDKKVWFGYWKDDGFVLVKHKGRIDKYNRWEKIKKEWVSAYRNKEVKPGFSVMQKVTYKDEWCAEAYMETDYSQLTEKDFIETIKKYVAFEFLNNNLTSGGTHEIS